MKQGPTSHVHVSRCFGRTFPASLGAIGNAGEQRNKRPLRSFDLPYRKGAKYQGTRGLCRFPQIIVRLVGVGITRSHRTPIQELELDRTSKCLSSNGIPARASFSAESASLDRTFAIRMVHALLTLPARSETNAEGRCRLLNVERIVIAAQSIANIVKSSLGPLGLDKMLVDNIGVRGDTFGEYFDC